MIGRKWKHSDFVDTAVQIAPRLLGQYIGPRYADYDLCRPHCRNGSLWRDV
jgi:hypothetical protein